MPRLQSGPGGNWCSGVSLHEMLQSPKIREEGSGGLMVIVTTEVWRSCHDVVLFLLVSRVNRR